MTIQSRHQMVAAIYPASRGIAFAVFEGALAPLEWIVTGSDRRKGDIRSIEKLLDRYPVDVVVLHDMEEGRALRSKKTVELNRAIFDLAEEKGIVVHGISREQIRQTFNHLVPPTKYAIAESIAANIPAFESILPPRRKPWMSEHSRMAIFHAAALALAYFGLCERSGVPVAPEGAGRHLQTP